VSEVTTEDGGEDNINIFHLTLKQRRDIEECKLARRMRREGRRDFVDLL
jgi:hypothetical protein